MPKIEETLADIDRITVLDDPVLRNLWITQRYHDLSLGLSKVVDAGNLNWSSFACWASLTAGISIRNRELPQFLMTTFRKKHWLTSLALTVLGRVGKLTSSINAQARLVLAEVSAEVAAGNLKVFKELAPVFARFIDVSNDPAVEEARLIPALALKPGPVDKDGQDLLERAFTCYARARASSHAGAKAQLILLGNCLIGLHEQTRLQSNIQAALEAPVDQLLFDRLAPATKLPLLGKVVGGAIKTLGRTVKETWDEVLTRYAMNLSLPAGTEISLHGDVPKRATEFPNDLVLLDNEDLVDLLSSYDHRLDTLINSGANNWAALPDRMGFIVDLFRSRQQDLTLFGEPFTDEQRGSLAKALVPGDLDPTLLPAASVS